MKKLRFFFGALLLIGAILLMRYVYVQLSYDFSWGYINTYSQEKSKLKGRFIKNLEPTPKEIYFDEEYNLLLNDAWLEYGRAIKKSTFSIKEEPSYSTLVLNVHYKYKNKKTGELKNYVETRPVCLTTLDEKFSAKIDFNLNLLSIHIDYPDSSENPIKLKVSDGSSPGVIVTFK